MIDKRSYMTRVFLLIFCALLLGWSGLAFAGEKTLELMSGDVYNYVSEEFDLRRVIVGNPDIIHVDVTGKNEIVLVGKKLGNTKILLKGEGTEATTLDIMVSPDVTTLKRRINELFPGQDIKIYSNNSGVILSGTVTGTEVIEQVLRVANQLLLATEDKGKAAVQINKKVKSSATKEELAQVISEGKGITVEAVANQESGASTGQSGPSIINLMKVGGPQQVLLEVKFAEVNRQSTRELEAGIGLGKLGKDFSGAFSASGAVTTPFDATGLSGVIPGGTIGTLDDVSISGMANAPRSLFLNLTGGGANVFVNIDNFTAMLRFLEEERLGRILAEPKLVTMNGQEASFLAGGEYPFQEVDDDGNVGIDFKDYGVGLRFTPIVNSDGLITLRVSPSVTDISELVDAGLGGQQAVFSSRKLDTTVQLHDGQTLALAGLLQNNLSEVVSKIPLLGDIPILGTLFRSTNYLEQKTDLLIAVTPHLIKPVNEGDIIFPGEFIKPPNRFEFYLEGKLEGRRQAADPSAFSVHSFQAPAETGGLEGDFGHESAQ